MTRSVVGLGLLLCVGFSAASASATTLEHPFLETFGSTEQPSFTDAQGMAVDQSTGDLLVIDAGNREPGEGTISRWHEDGTPSDFSALGTNVIEGPTFRFPEVAQVAVDNSGGPTDGNIYVASHVDVGVVRIFDKDGNALGQLTEYNAGPVAEGAATPLGVACGVAVDPDGNVFIGEGNNGGMIHKYEPAANPPVNGDNSANFAFSEACTLAAGAGATDGAIFPAHIFGLPETGAVAKLDSAGGTEQYEVDPGPTTTVTVDPGNGHLYVASGSEVREYDASGATEAVPLSAIAPGGEPVFGVAVNEVTGNVYIARKGSPQIEVWGPAALLPEAITETASVVGGTVTLRGSVNALEGPPTSCLFEYVEIGATGFEGASTVPCSPAGPFTGNAGVAVSAEIAGLPEAAYRFRLVASNENGPRRGQTLLFNTFERIPGLPDGRAYEMVSPPQKIGEVFPREPNSAFGSCGECLPGINVQVMPMQSAPDGEAILYGGQPFSIGLASGGNEYLARRGAGGWGTENLSSPLFQTIFAQGYAAFSSDLSRGVVYQANPILSPEAPSRDGEGFANLYLWEGGTLEPLVREEPPNRDPGVPGSDKEPFLVRYAGANAGTVLAPPFGHVIFEANDALTEAAPEVEADEDCAFLGSNCNLYEWVGGQLRLVNVLPDESAALAAVIGSGRLLSDGAETPVVDRAISDDGSRIFWSEEGSGQAYVRIEGEETLEIPGPGLCKESVPEAERVCFLTASGDGSRVLLSDGQVYELNGAGSAYEPGADLTGGEGGFKGILGASEDLARVYFVDTEALTEESEENANGEHAEEGEFNLYGWDEGETTFIGVLDVLDNNQGTLNRNGTWKASRTMRLAQVSPEGRHLAFMSHAALTGYNNLRRGGGICVGSSSMSCNEVFVYDAVTGELACASCNPSGERPLGHSVLSVTKPPNAFFPFPQAGNLSLEGNGRVFFDSQDTLSPRDTNGQIQDVYEWEPNGVGSCRRAGGCVYLISNGRSGNDSMFLDSTPSGDDAFFITRERLVPADRNSQLDVYDARAPHVPGEAVGFPEAGSPSCVAEACAGPLAPPPPPPGVGSGEFSGPGNPPPPRQPTCKRGFVKKQGKCVKKKPKKHKGAGGRNRGALR